MQSAGTVTAVSALFAGNGAVDYAGNIGEPTRCSRPPPPGRSPDRVTRLTSIRCSTPTDSRTTAAPPRPIALQSGSPALGAGANPEKLFTDQRAGYAREPALAGPISAATSDAKADTTAPTATLFAPNVSPNNPHSPNPYVFSITFSDNVAVAVASLAGSRLKCFPRARPPRAATVVSTTPVGNADGYGNAHRGFVVSYEVGTPGGCEYIDSGTYTVTLGGGPVTDLAGNAVAAGTVGTFYTVQATASGLNLQNDHERAWTFRTRGFFSATGRRPQPNPLRASITAGNSFGLTITAEDLLHGL